MSDDRGPWSLSSDDCWALGVAAVAPYGSDMTIGGVGSTVGRCLSFHPAKEKLDRFSFVVDAFAACASARKTVSKLVALMRLAREKLPLRFLLGKIFLMPE